MSQLRLVKDTLVGYLRLAFFFLHSAGGWGRARRAGEKRVLILAEALPPFVTAGTFRPLSWLKYAEVNGWRYQALSLDESSGFSTSAYVRVPERAGCGVDYVASDNRRFSWKLFPDVDGGLYTAFNYYRAAVRRMSGEAPSVIVATGPSFCSFVAGYLLSRYFSAPLVIDFRDEWSICPRDFVAKYPFDRFWERLCVKRSRKAYFTAPSMLHAYQELYPEFQDRFALLTNGIEVQDVPSGTALPIAAPAAQTLLIRHVGTVGTWTNPLSFVSTINALLERLPFTPLVEFVGGFDERIRKQIQAVARFGVAFTGKVDKDRAHLLMDSADLLLMLAMTGNEKIYPLKMFDYLYTDKPILVYGAACDMSAVILENRAGGLVAPEDPEALRCALEEVWAHRGDGYYASPARQRWINEHTREKLAGRFYRELERLEEGAAGAGVPEEGV